MLGWRRRSCGSPFSSVAMAEAVILDCLLCGYCVCVCVCVCVRACVGRGTERQVGEREREGETGSKGGREIGENPPAGLGAGN